MTHKPMTALSATFYIWVIWVNGLYLTHMTHDVCVCSLIDSKLCSLIDSTLL